MIKFEILVENKTDNPGIMAEHGLSIYIKTDEKKILFDAGASDLIIKNANKMNTDLSTIDFAIISHGHYDHTGGFPSFHNVNNKAPIYIHENAIKKYHGKHNGKIEKAMCGIRWTADEKALLDQSLFFTKRPLWINENIVISGTIPNVDGIVPTEQFYYEENGEMIPDDMSHEQFLAINNENGIILFSGCSHKGVIPAVKYCKELFPGEKIILLVAGMHLYSADKATRERVINQVIEEDIEKVMPLHCTGINAICDLKSQMGERCIVATAGDVYEY